MEGKDAPFKPARYWHNQIQAAEEREEKKWRKAARKVIARYLDERKDYESAPGCNRKVNILWSNTEVMRGNLFAELGKPDVRRAFPKPGVANKIARTAALVLERNLVACGNRYAVETEIEDAITDYLLPGRGQCWIEYEPSFTVDEETGEETLGYQTVEIAQVCWDDWTHGPAKRWRDVPWVARKHMFTAEDCANAWPDHNGADGRTTIPCHYVLLEGKDRSEEQGGEDFRRATIWEIWDKKSRQRIYVARDFEWVLEETPDPYNLEDFFPCPKPLYSVKFTDNLLPRPEYLQYKDQAEELDRLNTRIWRLLESLKYRGIILGQADPEGKLQDITQLEDGQFMHMKTFQQLAQGAGLKDAAQVLDLAPIVVAIQGAAERAVQLIQSIYEITGISDVIRGATDPRETKGAQQLKAQFGSQRIRKRQKEVQNFVKALYRMKAELIAEKFQREQLSEAAGILLPTNAEREQARQLLAIVEQQKQAAQQAQQPPQMGHNGGPPMDGPTPQMPPQGMPMGQEMAA